MGFFDKFFKFETEKKENKVDLVLETYSKQMDIYDLFLEKKGRLDSGRLAIDRFILNREGKKIDDMELKISTLICSVLDLFESAEWTEEVSSPWKNAIKENLNTSENAVIFCLSSFRPSCLFKKEDFYKQNMSNTRKKIIDMVIQTYRQNHPAESKKIDYECARKLLFNQMKTTFTRVKNEIGTKYSKESQYQFDDYLDDDSREYILVKFLKGHYFLIDLTNKVLEYFDIGNWYTEEPDTEGYYSKILDIKEEYYSVIRDYVDIIKNLGLMPHKIYDVYQGGIRYSNIDHELANFEDPTIRYTDIEIAEELTTIIYAMIENIPLDEITQLRAYHEEFKSPNVKYIKPYVDVTKKSIKKMVSISHSLKIYNSLDCITKNKIYSYCGSVVHPIYDLAFGDEEREFNDDEETRYLLMVHASILVIGYELGKLTQIPDEYLIPYAIGALGTLPLFEKIEDTSLSSDEIRDILLESILEFYEKFEREG